MHRPLLAVAASLALSCAAEAPRTSDAEPIASSAAPSSARASSAAASASGAPHTSSSAAPSTAGHAPFAPDQVFVNVQKGRIKTIQLWQRNEGQKGKETNLSAADACANGKQMMSWVMNSGLFDVEADAPAKAGPLADPAATFRFTTEDMKYPKVQEARVEIVAIDAKPAVGSHAAKARLKIFARDESGVLIEGTFDATACIDTPSSV